MALFERAIFLPERAELRLKRHDYLRLHTVRLLKLANLGLRRLPTQCLNSIHLCRLIN